MCLCGLLNITHSVHLILCIEVFFALILLIQSPDLLTMNGTYFYFLGFFDGGGWFFFALHVSCEFFFENKYVQSIIDPFYSPVCITCLISSALLYIGSRCQMPSLILPHVFWQFGFIIVSVLAIIVLMTLGFSGKMLMPSSIVLSSMMGVAGEFLHFFSTKTFQFQVSARCGGVSYLLPTTDMFVIPRTGRSPRQCPQMRILCVPGTV
ncbi:hypothetical protein CRE_21155 [Caenorhabditis remanei]|uniref:Uncharacterized protein n=1 Tax=Caenorhabditis remanei TaxID=31234 RepID=E3MF13_CAERE|nr:hypothetical protein CRE_21155 [Caenorhabditis remanei]